MPAALGLALFNFGAPLAIVNAVVGVGTAGLLLHTAAYIAISVGLSYVSGILFRPQVPQQPSQGQQEIQQAVPPRVMHYGRLRFAGFVGFYESRVIEDTGEPGLFKLNLLQAREADAFEEFRLDNMIVTLDGSGFVEQDKYIGGGDLSRVLMGVHLGTDSQTVDNIILDDFADIWSSAHRLRGIAYIVSRYASDNPQAFTEMFPNRDPTLTVTGRWAKLYDPRLDGSIPGGSGAHRHNNKATWAWSDNAALIVLDYLTHADGYNRPIAKIDLASFQVMADICDEDVPLKAGGTENRYRSATSVYLTEKRTEVLARLLEACDASLHDQADGTWRIAGGEWIAPTVTLDASLGHIIEAEWRGGASAMERYNELAIKYLSPPHGYSEVEGDPWQATTDPDFIAGLVETRPLDLLQVPSHGQARRLAKIRIARDNPEWAGTILTNYVGLDAIGERCIHIIDPLLAIDHDFWIEQLEVMGDGTGTRITVRSANEDAYDWDEDTEEGTAPPVPIEVENEPGPGE